jgi:uncharacterized protein (TIGR00255 family)
MISSMTGFARLEGRSGAWSWAVEARSVNGRNLEVRFRGPPGFESLERLAREAAQARFQRGQVTVSVQARRAEAAGGVRINRDQLERYLALAAEFANDGRASRPSLDGLLALRGVVEAGDDIDDPELHATVETAMGESLAGALEALKSARLGEGKALAPILEGLVDAIEAQARDAATEAAQQGPAIRDRFAGRLAELLGEAAPVERIMQEAAAMAAKADVREELDRLSSHVSAARALLAEAAPVGRRLDFLTQELMREANTLCAKSATTALTAAGLALKAVIDQFREQVQNVE